MTGVVEQSPQRRSAVSAGLRPGRDRPPARSAGWPPCPAAPAPRSTPGRADRPGNRSRSRPRRTPRPARRSGGAGRPAVRQGHHQPLADQRGDPGHRSEPGEQHGQPRVAGEAGGGPAEASTRGGGLVAAPLDHGRPSTVTVGPVTLPGDRQLLGHRPPFRRSRACVESWHRAPGRCCVEAGRAAPPTVVTRIAGQASVPVGRSAVAFPLAFSSCLSVPLQHNGRAISPRVPAPSAPVRVAWPATTPSSRASRRARAPTPRS